MNDERGRRTRLDHRDTQGSAASRAAPLLGENLLPNPPQRQLVARHPSHKLTAAIYCEVDGLPVEIEPLELSTAGLFVETPMPLAIDSEVEVFVRIGEVRFEASGHVVQAVSCEQATLRRRKPGYGLLFTNVSDAARAQLRRGIQALVVQRAAARVQDSAMAAQPPKRSLRAGPAAGGGTNKANPPLESRRPGADSRKPPSESRRPPADSRKPPNESRKPAVDSRKPPSDSRRDSRKPPSESRRPAVDARKSPSDSRKPPNDSRKPPSDSRKPPDDSRQRPGDARQPSDPARKPPSDARQSSDPARAPAGDSHQPSDAARPPLSDARKSLIEPPRAAIAMEPRWSQPEPRKPVEVRAPAPEASALIDELLQPSAASQASAPSPGEREVLENLRTQLRALDGKPAWTILAISQGADPADAKRAFFAASKRFHPHLYARFSAPEIKQVVTELFIVHKRAYTSMQKSAKSGRQSVVEHAAVLRAVSKQPGSGNK